MKGGSEGKAVSKVQHQLTRRVGPASVLALLGLSVALGGCVSSPTYGTGTPATQQLANDVSNILMIGPKKREQIAYNPRPELVRPAPGQKEQLVEPQQAVASAQNPDWPESPEQRRARVRAEATENQDNPYYRSEVAMDGTRAASFSPKVNTSPRKDEKIIGDGRDSKATREAFNERLKEQRQGDPNVRRFLSEPPLAYRQASAAAPQDDVGEDEWKKERRLKAEAKKRSGGGSGWFDWLPGVGN